MFFNQRNILRRLPKTPCSTFSREIIYYALIDGPSINTSPFEHVALILGYIHFLFS